VEACSRWHRPSWAIPSLQKRGLAFALYGITAICAPAIGPTLGGWITDNYSWRWIFYINVPVGALALALVYQLVEDPPYVAGLRQRLSRFDFIGFSLLTVGVGALQIALDKGQEDDWFGSVFITTLVVIAIVGLVSLIIWEWFQKEPIVDVRLFKNSNFAASSVMYLMLGMALFSSTVLMPQLLQTLMGYTAQKAGMVLSAGALVVLVAPRGGQTHNTISSSPSAGIWLDNSGGEHVLVVQTYQSAYKFQLGYLTACLAVSPCRLSICTSHTCRIRGPASWKNQCCRGAHEFHA
jgi:EmrB/QacA subfamily drug resistance transporter